MSESNELRVSIVIDGVKTHDYEKMRNFFHFVCGAVSGMLNMSDVDTVTECGYAYYVIEESVEAAEREKRETFL